jgi:putative glutamine amidotransferase
MVIGITDPMRDEETYAKYVMLVKRWMPQAETQILSIVHGNFGVFDKCDAIILSGGGDVHPKFYGRQDAASLAREVSVGRDLFEFDLIHRAIDQRRPILGICRGFQVFNVAMGGTLIPDIEAAGFASHRKGDTAERVHPVSIVSGSTLHSVVGATEGTVNTYHHQGLEKAGEGLLVSARSDDGIAEAAEWKDPRGKSFLLLVQWHPERMAEVASPFAKNLIEKFAAEIQLASSA